MCTLVGEWGTYFSVLERASMQTHRAVREEGLHLGDEQVALLEERPHLQLVRFKFPSLRVEHSLGALLASRTELVGALVRLRED